MSVIITFRVLLFCQEGNYLILHVPLRGVNKDVMQINQIYSRKALSLFNCLFERIGRFF